MFRTLLRALALVALLADPGWALSWSFGSNLGISTVRSNKDGSGTSTVLAWPTNALAYQPALRVGIGDSRHAHEVLQDSGLFMIDEAGSTLSLFAFLGSYQHTLFADRANAPFANIGVGLYREGGAALTSTTRSGGVGVGLRHVVNDRHGTVRGEVRVDYLKHDDTFGRPDLTTIGLRLGFDLWL